MALIKICYTPLLKTVPSYAFFSNFISVFLFCLLFSFGVGMLITSFSVLLDLSKVTTLCKIAYNNPLAHSFSLSTY